MNSGTVFSFMDIIIVACGAYILYAYYLLVAKNELKKGVLVSQNTDTKKCKDFNGYRNYIKNRVLLLGIAALISGGVGLYQDYVGPAPFVVYICSMLLFFAAIVWYVIGVKKAEKLYW